MLRCSFYIVKTKEAFGSRRFLLFLLRKLFVHSSDRVINVGPRNHQPSPQCKFPLPPGHCVRHRPRICPPAYKVQSSYCIQPAHITGYCSQRCTVLSTSEMANRFAFKDSAVKRRFSLFSYCLKCCDRANDKVSF